MHTAKGPPTSAGHTEHDQQRPADTPPGTDQGPSDQRHRAPSTPDGSRAATQSTTAASTASDRGHTQRNLEPSRKSLNLNPVSYTHLRAHETDSYLVCRLLL